MGRLTLVLFSSPEGGEAGTLALNLLRAARNLGHDVSVFALGDGIYHALEPGKGQEELDNHGVLHRMRHMMQMEMDSPHPIQFEICAHSAQERGIVPEEMMPGVKMSSTSQLGTWIGDSQRCLFLGL